MPQMNERDWAASGAESVSKITGEGSRGFRLAGTQSNAPQGPWRKVCAGSDLTGPRLPS